MIEILIEAHKSFDTALLDIVVLLSAGLPLIPVASNGLAVVNESAIEITGRFKTVTGSSNVSIVSIMFCCLFIIIDLKGMVVEATGTHVSEVILRNIVPH